MAHPHKTISAVGFRFTHIEYVKNRTIMEKVSKGGTSMATYSEPQCFITSYPSHKIAFSIESIDRSEQHCSLTDDGETLGGGLKSPACYHGNTTREMWTRRSGSSLNMRKQQR